MSWWNHARGIAILALLSPAACATVLALPVTCLGFVLEPSLVSLRVLGTVWLYGVFFTYVFGGSPALVGFLLYVTWVTLRPHAASTIHRGMLCGVAACLLLRAVSELMPELRIIGTGGVLDALVPLSGAIAGGTVASIRDQRALAAH